MSPAAGIRAFVANARRATLATLGPAGRPRLLPICFVLAQPAVLDTAGRPSDPGSPVGVNGLLVLYSAIDEKPKRTADPLRLARVRDILARPEATVLVDRWDERWERLAWVRLQCRAEILPVGETDHGERERAFAALRAKYPQYRLQRLESRPLIRLTCEVAAAWGDLAKEVR